MTTTCFRELLEKREKPFRYEDMLKLDAKDEKIIVELERNSRSSISRIAKNTKLSRDVVKYRIEKMIKSGFIDAFIPTIDINKLGLHWHVILLRVQNLPLQVENKLKNYILNEKKIRWALKSNGIWNSIIHVNAENMIEYNKILSKVRDICQNYLQDFESILGIKEHQYNNLITGFLTKIKSSSRDISLSFPFGRFDENESQVEIDETDRKILRMLIKNARVPLLEISKKIKLSPDATKYRIRNLKKKGILRGFVTVVNTPLQGCSLYMILLQLKNINERNKKEFIEYLKDHKFICHVSEISGKYDLWIHVWPKDPGHFDEIMREIRSKFQKIIKDYISLLGLGEYKFGDPPI